MRSGVQTLERSSVRRREWVPRTQEGSEAGTEAHGESAERDFSKGGGSKQRFLYEPGLTACEGRTVTPGASMERCTSGSEQWTQTGTATSQERAVGWEPHWRGPTELGTRSHCCFLWQLPAWGGERIQAGRRSGSQVQTEGGTWMLQA